MSSNNQGSRAVWRAAGPCGAAASCGALAVALGLLLLSCQSSPVAVTGDVEAHDPLDREAVYTAYHRGLEAEMAGDFDGAIDAYRGLLATAPDSVHLNTVLARLLLRTGRVDGATQSLEALLARRPDVAEAQLLLGHAYDRAGQREAALAAYRKAVELDPRSVPGWKKLAALSLAQDDYERAAEAFEQLVRVDRELTYFHRRELARCYMELGQHRKAARELETYLAVYPDADGWYDLGTAYTQLGMTEQAREAFQQAVSHSPYSFRAYQALADLAYFEGRLGDAFTAYRHAYRLAAEARIRNTHALKRLGLIAFVTKSYEVARPYLLEYAQLHPDDQDVVWRLALCYVFLDDYEEGAATFEAWLKRHPGSPALALALSHIYYRWGKPEASLAAVDSLLSSTEVELLPRQRALVHLSAGRAYADVERLDDARRAFEAAIEADPTYADAYIALAVTLSEQQRAEEGICALEGLLSRGDAGLSGPRSAMVLATLGRLYAGAERYEEARDALMKALELDPTDESAALALMFVHMRLEDYKGTVHFVDSYMADERVRPSTDALADLHYYAARALTKLKRYEEAVSRVQAILPGIPTEQTLGLRLQLALALSDGGRSDDALKVAEGLVEDFPDNAETLNFLGYMYAEKGVQLATAEALIGKALRLAPDDGNIVDSLGWVFYQQGEYAKAVVELERAIEMTGGDPIIHDHLGDAYYRLGRVQEAVQQWETAIKSGNERPKEIRGKIEQARQRANEQAHNR